MSSSQENAPAKEGKKYDTGKPTPQFIDPVFVLEIAAAMGFGEHKYGPWNFVGGMRWSRLIGAFFRHVLKFAAGIDLDKESGLCHLSLAGASLNMLYVHWRAKLGQDDRLKLPMTEEHIDRITDTLISAIEAWEKQKRARRDDLTKKMYGTM